MTIESGTRLGPYEVIAPIGAGGMGEVYEAKDTRLDRTVAIKVLPEHLAESPERKARFEREAKAISQLNHPHICTLHDVGEQDGVDFIVMEYIEGETLAARLKKGALKLDEALEYGVQIADGLDKAHRAGIIHRDLKPANAMLTKSGIKLLDFGLARLVHEEDEAPVTSDAPTRQRDLTGEESIIGTLQYMAPEQLERKPADARTDIFAFGALLYEMITGKKAFEGTSQASLIGAILEREPESISTFQPLASLALERVVKKCLAKNPEDRYHSMHDLADELRWIREGSDESVGKAGTAGSRLRPRIGFFVGALLAGLAIFLLLADSGPSSRAVRFSIAVPEEFAGSTNTMTAIASDGSRVAYVANDVIHVREVDQLGARPLAATEGDPQALTFSPDGEWIAYWTNGALKKAPVSGGTPVQLCEVEVPFGLLWTDDDVLRFGLSSGGIWEVEGDGGTLKSVMSTAEAVWRPQLLPDGRTYLFVSAFSPYRIAVQSTEDTEARVLSEGGLNPRYVETGHLLFQMSNELMAVPFDLERLVLIGSPVPVIEASDWQFDVSRNGTLLYVPPALPNTRIVWVDRNGNVSLAVDERQLFSRPHLSQDGRRVAVEIRSSFSERDLWVYDLERGSRTRVTSGDAAEQDPVWTPDGERIVFTLSNADSGDLFSIFADGNGEPTLLLASDVTMDPHSFSPDGKHLAYYQRRGASRDIWVFDLDKEEPQPFVVTEFNERSPSFSPDGRFIAYVSNASGRDEVYVQPYPGPGRLTVISTGGGYGPVWSRDGKELFYRHGKRMMAVRLQSGPRFRASVPETLFEGEFLTEEGSDSGSRTYDVSLDGKRFLMVERGETRAEIHVVVNWFEELKRLVPIGN